MRPASFGNANTGFWGIGTLSNGFQSLSYLFVLRLYSGLSDSVLNGVWRPKGVPAISNILTRIDATEHNSIVVFYDIDNRLLNNSGGLYKFCLSGLVHPIYVLKPPKFLGYFGSRVREFLTPIYLALWCLMKVRDCSPDLFYTDRYNVYGAALVAKLTNSKTVLRLLGMPPKFAIEIGTNRLTPTLQRMAFKTKFDHIIATRDGSLIKRFIVQFTNERTTNDVLLNGANEITKSRLHCSDPIQIVFVGRLEKGKGIEDFIDGCLTYFEKHKGLHPVFNVNIIGDGALEDEMRRRTSKKFQQGLFTFWGSLDHSQVLDVLKQCDIYVSFNEFGQLANTNIEAAKAGLCMVLSETELGDDPDAKIIFDPYSVTWLSAKNRGIELSEVLHKFARNPERIMEQKKRARSISKLFQTWRCRVGWELDLLKTIASGR